MTTVVKSNNENTPRRVRILWQASGDSTLRLPSQPAWNDARGEVLAQVLPAVQNVLKIPLEGAFLVQGRINAPPHRQRAA